MNVYIAKLKHRTFALHITIVEVQVTFVCT